MTLVDSILNGDRLALSRLLSQIENDTDMGRSILSELFAHTGQAHLVGVTGAPGTGKSSLVNHLVRYYRRSTSAVEAPRVAIIAIDPSSPFSGGAILGDRIRMRDLAGDPGVFIRSMASRGSLGGLAKATAALTQAFDAAGFEIIIIETVGAGQAEVDIARLAHTTVVVEAPGFGDEIQAIKAGILEIADVLVINKADRPGAENTERALRSMLDLAHPGSRNFKYSGHHFSSFNLEEVQKEENSQFWRPPIVRTVATEGAGIDELGEKIALHKDHLRQTGDWSHRERARLKAEMDQLLQENLVTRWRKRLPPDVYKETLEGLLQRKYSPREAAALLIRES
jgi:LAO/AO transport system kinase